MLAGSICRKLVGGPINPKFNVCGRLEDALMRVSRVAIKGIERLTPHYNCGLQFSAPSGRHPHPRQWSTLRFSDVGLFRREHHHQQLFIQERTR